MSRKAKTRKSLWKMARQPCPCAQWRLQLSRDCPLCPSHARCVIIVPQNLRFPWSSRLVLFALHHPVAAIAGCCFFARTCLHHVPCLSISTVMLASLLHLPASPRSSVWSWFSVEMRSVALSQQHICSCWFCISEDSTVGLYSNACSCCHCKMTSRAPWQAPQGPPAC